MNIRALLDKDGNNIGTRFELFREDLLLLVEEAKKQGLEEVASTLKEAIVFLDEQSALKNN